VADIATRVLISCGEPSGDLYGAELVRRLRTRLPGLDVFGLGGDHLESAGARLHAHVRELAVVGLVEVLRHLPRFRTIFNGVLAEVERHPPDVAVLVDYPDFNLRLAGALHRRGVPVVYYVSPQLWAWRGGRMKHIRRSVARVLVIFPFEERLYREAGVPVTFVGHPLVDTVRPEADRASFLRTLDLDPARPTLAVLPGSRPKELGHNLPALVGALRLIAARRPDVQPVLALAPSLERGPVDTLARGLPLRVVAGRTHGVVGTAAAALVASGTATVETALLGTPMVVVYRVSPLTYALGRPLVRVSQFAMVNLIAGRPIVPELIQRDFTPERVAAEALALLDDPARATRMRADLAAVRAALGAPGASERAAVEVLRLLEERRRTA
jgi:lipid-A-disaccharide synthase